MPPLGNVLASNGLNVSVRNTFLHCDDSDEADNDEVGQPGILRSKTAPEYRKRGDSEVAAAGEDELDGAGVDDGDAAVDGDESEASSTESSEQPKILHQDTYDAFDALNPAMLTAMNLSTHLPPPPTPEAGADRSGTSSSVSHEDPCVANGSSCRPPPADGNSGAAPLYCSMGPTAAPQAAVASPPMLLGRRGGAPAAAESGVAGKAARSTGGGDPRTRTTVMLRNLPNNYTRAALLELIDREGFTGRYDFVYLPIDFKTHAALGYAFLNMVTPEDAERLRKRLDGFSRWSLPSSKVCNVGWSHPHQGLESHIARYRNSPLMHEAVPDAYRPALFANGARVAFPPPTKKIKPPRQGTQRMLV
mmetsp:Transcript_5149/g.14739  ORF Transcript_5149/g.14739 Transcript_5149/m.14739 type:complete len:362 (+) Transcript_5149:149-1234(+)